MIRIKKIIEQIRYIFTKEQKIQFLFLFIVITFTTFLELLGVTAIMPLIDVMLMPETIKETKYLNWMYTVSGVNTSQEFLVVLAGGLIIIYILKNIFVAIMYKLQYYYTYSSQRELANKMLECYMRQPYFFHLSHSSSDLIRTINTDTVMMFQGILAIVQLFAEISVCIVLGAYLLLQDPTITLGIVATLLVFLLLFARKFKTYLSKIGSLSREHSAGIIKWLQQSFGGMKETKIMGREKYFLNHFDQEYHSWVDTEKSYRYLQLIPRPIVESICICTLMIAVIIKIASGVESEGFIGTISVFAIAAFRLLPSFNRITAFVSSLLFNLPAFDAVYEEMKEIDRISGNQVLVEEKENILKLQNEIKISNLSFKYPAGEDYVLENINLSIPKNKSVALIGPSGAGKTTLADLILGALEPTEGNIYIDGTNAFNNIRAWQKNVGYIPQNIYLMDDTIKNNIIYGAIHEETDDSILWQAIERAQLTEFIQSLSEGLETKVGEQGIRLSGGQRQRIGIARALYSNPDVLVLDEATSALDNDTEKAVMDAIESLAGSKTLIIIAHRLSTIKNCDLQFEVKERKVCLKKVYDKEDYR